MTDYYDQHCACPRCGSMDIEQTTVGYLGTTAVDSNRAACCACDWVGIVHDLVAHEDDA